MSPRKSLPPEQRAGYDPSKCPTFCRRVRERRESIGMTQLDLGAAIGIRKQEVSTLEGGKFPRDHDRIVAIAKALQTDLNYLFGLTDED